MVTRRAIGVVGQVVNVTRRGAAGLVQLGRRPVVAVPVLVLAVRLVLGVWPAALAGAVAGTVGLLFGLAAWDRRVRPRPVGPRVEVVEVVQVGPRAGGGVHVEFARGLAGLADWYLSECERETQR
ncbi:MAG TPA: hypothetical protein VFZ68_02270 [Acidimicrobiales bacterium]